jgi:hypothetical protein
MSSVVIQLRPIAALYYSKQNGFLLLPFLLSLKMDKIKMVQESLYSFLGVSVHILGLQPCPISANLIGENVCRSTPIIRQCCFPFFTTVLQKSL